MSLLILYFPTYFHFTYDLFFFFIFTIYLFQQRSNIDIKPLQFILITSFIFKAFHLNIDNYYKFNLFIFKMFVLIIYNQIKKQIKIFLFLYILKNVDFSFAFFLYSGCTFELCTYIQNNLSLSCFGISPHTDKQYTPNKQT